MLPEPDRCYGVGSVETCTLLFLHLDIVPKWSTPHSQLYHHLLWDTQEVNSHLLVAFLISSNTQYCHSILCKMFTTVCFSARSINPTGKWLSIRGMQRLVQTAREGDVAEDSPEYLWSEEHCHFKEAGNMRKRKVVKWKNSHIFHITPDSVNIVLLALETSIEIYTRLLFWKLFLKS